jgi:chromosome segregation ATPase
MDVENDPPDEVPPGPNANQPNGDDVFSLDSQVDSSLSESSGEDVSDTDDGSSVAGDIRQKLRKSSAAVKRLTKTVTAKKRYITRLKNQKIELAGSHAKKLAAGKLLQTNLKNTIQQERSSRTQIKAGIRNQYLEDIKSAQILEKTAKKAQKQAERETTRARNEYESLHDTIAENSATISKYRQDVVETHREKASLKQTVKDQDKELKTLRLKLAKYNATTKNKQLEIENARTERARIDAEARTSKDDKRIREIAAAHESKMNLLQEQNRLKAQDKIDREKAKVDAATKKQKADMAKLDSSVSTYHGSSMMPNNGGVFPGGNALLQVSLLFYCATMEYGIWNLLLTYCYLTLKVIAATADVVDDVGSRWRYAAA